MFTGFRSGFQSFFTKVWVCFNQSRDKYSLVTICNCATSIQFVPRRVIPSMLWFVVLRVFPPPFLLQYYIALPTFLTSWSGLLSMQHELVRDAWFCSISPCYFCCPGRHGEEVWERLHYGSIRHSVFQSPLVMSFLHVEIALARSRTVLNHRYPWLKHCSRGALFRGSEFSLLHVPCHWLSV